jgi:hypothetical protein
MNSPGCQIPRLPNPDPRIVALPIITSLLPPAAPDFNASGRSCSSKLPRRQGWPKLLTPFNPDQPHGYLQFVSFRRANAKFEGLTTKPEVSVYKCIYFLTVVTSVVHEFSETKGYYPHLSVPFFVYKD